MSRSCQFDGADALTGLLLARKAALYASGVLAVLDRQSSHEVGLVGIFRRVVLVLPTHHSPSLTGPRQLTALYAQVMGFGNAPEIFVTKTRLGLRKTLAGLDYSRSVEYPAALAVLKPSSARRILEIGSSKLPLAVYLATHTAAEVYATDLDPLVRVQSDYARRLGINDNRLRVGVEDARHLTFPDQYFDRVISVSTIEHIQAVEQAAEEIGRVLSPGGIAVITVPFSRRAQVQSLSRPAYGGTFDQDPTFYQYIFDKTMLFSRVLDHTGLVVDRIVYLGEPFVRLTRLVYHPVTGRLLRPMRVVWPWVARFFYRIIDEDQVTDGGENIAIVALHRPEEPAASD